ncbi:prolipoprotein diacylglyceryl transferase [Blochmannia endosymbiont of Camponotus modoc]|uniref:prolipoprotein diacylglyceryl transferase n=1 Tax=Blochmannia endosymbiont of Camponotus modoc TaxID=2945587 RepID=UPI002025B0BF|nr:prolipoprotein diacylglyceryl transferase [Blochmannia endosymbiont of Camponotus modoc]URJ29187.1 prolipoprotein diacylglyceryl transferase [Blochmannia endosymbiont of Camponotus modoc]
MQNLYYHACNPIIFTIGPISLHWYGVMYGLGFIYAMWSLSCRMHHLKNVSWTHTDVEHLLCLCFLGVLLGGRIGYVLFYQWSFFSNNLLWIFKIWEGGMSFHGGLIGVIISIAWFSHKKRRPFFQISDFVVPAVPFGLGLGRLGNFINGELWGRIAIDIPWAMLFPNSVYQDLLILPDHPEWEPLFDSYGVLPRHPSQLYEMFLEGVILFIIISKFIRQPHPVGSVSGLFLICYGVFRIIAEIFRQPDSQLGLINNIATMGQILSCPMIILGMIIVYLAYR